MATQSNFGRSRTSTFVVRRVAGKASASHLRLVKPEVRGCEPIRMTQEEASVFFAACETPAPVELNIFEHLPEVAQWFQD